MSYSDPCRGDCGANHWPDCSPDCSSRQPPTKEEIEAGRIRWEAEKKILEEGKAICEKEGHLWEYVFIIDRCKRCGETTEY